MAYKLTPDIVKYAYRNHYGGLRKEKITGIIIHHAAAVWSTQQLLDFMAGGSRHVSSTFAIGNDGLLGLAVPETHRPHTTSGYHDEYAITVEVCNSRAGGDWPVSDKALNKLIQLVAYVCDKYGLEPSFTGGKDGTIRYHGMYESTACPGPYLKSRMKHIEQEAKKLLAGQKEPTPSDSPVTDKNLYRVQVGAYKVDKNAIAMRDKLKAKGYDTYVVKVDGLIKVQVGAFAVKKNAAALEAKLKKDGFPTFLTTKGGEKYTPTSPKIIVGSIVRVKKGAKDWNGNSLLDFVYNRDHRVSEISGKRAVITYAGVVVAAVSTDNLYLA